MNSHDEDIDKVLAGLKVAEPEDGMEARILQRLALKAERRAASPWRMRVAFALGAGVALGAVVLIVGHRPRAVPQVEKAHDVAAKPAMMDVPRPVVVAVGVTSPRVRPVRTAGVRTTFGEGGEQVASESFPAPPLPLTEQEKLLLRIAHRGETQATELPTPLPLGTEVAALRAGADKFFEDPTTGENKWKQLVALQAAPN